MTHLGWVPAHSRDAATYVMSTPRVSHRAPPCIWTFLSSLGENEFFSILSEAHISARISNDATEGSTPRGMPELGNSI